MITSVAKYFSGTTPDDFDPATKNHPFEPCPDSPNCGIHSVEYSIPGMELFKATKSALDKLSPSKIEVNSQALKINAVFRIPVFGFNDDVSIIVESTEDQKSMLHIKSSSRIGRGDLGVNRRRIKRIVTAIHQQF